MGIPLGRMEVHSTSIAQSNRFSGKINTFMRLVKQASNYLIELLGTEEQDGATFLCLSRNRAVRQSKPCLHSPRLLAAR